MSGMTPGPQQGQPGQAPGGQPSIPPEMLMALLAHLMTPQGQQGAPPPKDGSQTKSLGDLLPGILQALMGPQNSQAQGQQQSPQGQQAPQTQPQQGQQQQNPLASILQSLGIRLQ